MSGGTKPNVERGTARDPSDGDHRGAREVGRDEAGERDCGKSQMWCSASSREAEDEEIAKSEAERVS